MTDLTHVDENGNAVMIDVSAKADTERVAVATGSIEMNEAAYRAVTERRMKKGDVLTVSQIAGIMGTKRTADLIPLCHPIALTNAKIWYEMKDAKRTICVFCEARTCGKTGVEMEALTGVTVTLLTIYDMCKAVDKAMRITDVHLVEKRGGKSGDFVYE